MDESFPLVARNDESAKRKTPPTPQTEHCAFPWNKFFEQKKRKLLHLAFKSSQGRGKSLDFKLEFRLIDVMWAAHVKLIDIMWVAHAMHAP